MGSGARRHPAKIIEINVIDWDIPYPVYAKHIQLTVSNVYKCGINVDLHQKTARCSLLHDLIVPGT